MWNELKGKIFISSKTMGPMESWMLLFLFTGLYPGLCTVQKLHIFFFIREGLYCTFLVLTTNFELG